MAKKKRESKIRTKRSIRLKIMSFTTIVVIGVMADEVLSRVSSNAGGGAVAALKEMRNTYEFYGVGKYDLDKEDSAHSIFDRMISRETGYAEGMVNGQESYVAFCPIHGTQWAFAVEVPKEDYKKSTNNALLNNMVGTMAALIVALFVIYIITTMISNQLKKAIVRVNGLAEGDLSSQIEVRRSGDEVEILSRSLKTTIESVNGYITEISGRIEDLSAITRQNLQHAESTADASTELAEESQKLTDLLERFRFH